MEHTALHHIKPWQAWILAARPKTLTAAFIPVLVATALAHASHAAINWWITLSALLTGLCITIGTNLINDALDFKKGADTATRAGPMRVTQTGLIPLHKVHAAGLITLGMALVFGSVLIQAGGWFFAVLLIVSVICGYCYTGGPLPLSYHGLGEPFVILFYGFAAVTAVYYLQTGFVDGKAILASAQIGLLATLILAMNNFRDQNEDRKAQKKTLAVRFGSHFARLEITFLTLAPFLVNVGWFYWDLIPAAFFPFVLMPFAIQIVRKAWAMEPGKECNEIFVKSAMLHLSFGALLILGFVLS